MKNIKGTWSNEFMGVAEALSKNLETGEDIGSSAAVFINGEPVVDIWGGYFDKEKTRLWSLLNACKKRFINMRKLFSFAEFLKAVCGKCFKEIIDVSKW